MQSLKAPPYIRPAEPDDALAIARLFYDTVHHVNCRDYSPEQLAAWAPERDAEERFRLRQQRLVTFVAVAEEKIIGFAELHVAQDTADANPGRIDCFYVHKDAQRLGAGTLLMRRLKISASLRKIPELSAEVSITAKPFFERHDFETVQQQTVFRENVAFTNFLMKSALS